MKLPLLAATVAAIGSVTGCEYTAPSRQPVRSMLEERHDQVVTQKWDISCGAAALATLLTYDNNDSVTEKEVAAGLLKYTTVAKVQAQLGFSLLDLKKYSESRGFVATGLGEVTLIDLAGIGPAILPVVLRGYNHFVVFRGIQGDRVLLADPAWGNRTMLMSRFLDIWQSRIAFTVRRPGGPQLDHPLMARAQNFWASSERYQKPALMVAALAPDEKPVLASNKGTPHLERIAAGASDSMARRPVTDVSQPVGSDATSVASLEAPVKEPSHTPETKTAQAAKPAVTPVSLAKATEPPPQTTASLALLLTTRADEALGQGDVYAARRLYTLAVAVGDRGAAVALGKTYDPNFQANSSAPDLKPNSVIAAVWYTKAAAMGAPEAHALLEKLSVRRWAALALNGLRAY